MGALTVIDLVATLVALPFALAAGWLLATVALGVRDRRATGATPPDVQVAALVPAHDEAGGIAATVTGLLRQLRPGDHLLVVADNCTDETAARARNAATDASRDDRVSAGISIDVAERRDPAHRGKPWALAFGLERLGATPGGPPDAVLVLDADCRLDAGSIDALRSRVATDDRAAQALNLVDPPRDGGPRDRISAFAFAVKNRSRPRGLVRLGLPVHLLGTGMLLPWRDAQALAGGGERLAEDMGLGATLAAEGRGAVLVEAARVRSEAPRGAAAAHGQRTRWERGHLDAIRAEVPGLVRTALARRRPRLLAFALDLAVPPLALLVGLLALLAALAAGLVVAGVATPAALVLPGAGLAAVAGAVLLAAATTARGFVRPADLLLVPLYVAWKLPIYVGFALGRRVAWRRTARTARATPADAGGPPPVVGGDERLREAS